MRNINAPNALSLARLSLIPVAVCFLLRERFLPAAATVAFCGLLDILDGAAARRFSQETALGKLLDPLADKLLCAALFITLAAIGRIPSWFAGCVIARDALISLAALIIYKKHGFQTISTAAGKAAFIVLILAAVTAILFEDHIKPALVLSCMAMAGSLLSYALTYRYYLRQGAVKAA